MVQRRKITLVFIASLFIAVLGLTCLAGCSHGSDSQSQAESTETDDASQSDTSTTQADSPSQADASDETQAEDSQQQSTQPDDAAAQTTTDNPYATGIHHVIIEVADYGSIEVELNAAAAPVTVANFCTLAEAGFYDGLTFHRIIPGFMIQGGDPLGTGTGGSDETIVGEFSSNGYVNPIQHKRGVISMARSQDPNSASSQFFIMQGDADWLDGSYAAFGRVTSGMEIVDSICEHVGASDLADENGVLPASVQPVISSITVVD